MVEIVVDGFCDTVVPATIVQRYRMCSALDELGFRGPTDNGHPERAFFQKFETFGLGQTNWAEILGGILAISSQTIGTILAL